MVQAKAELPAGHGEVLTRPEFGEWASIARSNHALAQDWQFSVAGRPIAEVRALARREALSSAEEFSAKLGVTVASPKHPDGLVVATGHQPELYHPGVWIKDFLLQRLADETDATALDLVVDSDGFDVVRVSSPCMSPDLQRCRQYLAVGGTSSSYCFAPVPEAHDLDVFCSACDEMLATLPAPAIRRHFARFCEELRAARTVAENLGELVTIARRRYEAPAGTDYLELPMSVLSATESFSLFVADMALDACRFAEAYNTELAEYRIVNGTRSAAQPFPDLEQGDGRTELPLWHLAEGVRSTVWVNTHADGGVTLEDAAGETLVELGSDAEAAVRALCASSALIAPKALALTLFSRVFVCDLLIHGVGGGRYDRVTDGVCRRYYGVEPPGFVVASMTMYLPLGAHAVTDDEVAAAKERLNRLEHNPDAMLGDVDFETAAERARAVELAAEKSSLVAEIAQPGADKKTLGLRIREVNAELAEMLAPVREELAAAVASLESQMAAAEILSDRTYPFCFWAPEEVADKAR